MIFVSISTEYSVVFHRILPRYLESLLLDWGLSKILVLLLVKCLLVVHQIIDLMVLCFISLFRAY